MYSAADVLIYRYDIKIKRYTTLIKEADDQMNRFINLERKHKLHLVIIRDLEEKIKDYTLKLKAIQYNYNILLELQAENSLEHLFFDVRVYDVSDSRLIEMCCE